LAWASVGSTGMAACATGGQTLHTFAGCGLPDVVEDLDKIWKQQYRRKWRKLKVLLVDEVSVLSREVLDHLSSKVDHVQNYEQKTPNKSSGKAFGGIQLIFCGDIHQLPPMTPRKKKDEYHDDSDDDTKKRSEYEIVRNRGFAFESQVCRQSLFEMVELTQVYRQKGKEKFVRVLNNIRAGNCSKEDSFF